HTRFSRDWSSDVCSSDLGQVAVGADLDLGGKQEGKHGAFLPRDRLLTLDITPWPTPCRGCPHGLRTKVRGETETGGGKNRGGAGGCRSCRRTPSGRVRRCPSGWRR